MLSTDDFLFCGVSVVALQGFKSTTVSSSKLILCMTWQPLFLFFFIFFSNHLFFLKSHESCRSIEEKLQSSCFSRLMLWTCHFLCAPWGMSFWMKSWFLYKRVFHWAALQDLIVMLVARELCFLGSLILVTFADSLVN